MMTTTARYEPHDTTRHGTERNGTERHGIHSRILEHDDSARAGWTTLGAAAILRLTLRLSHTRSVRRLYAADDDDEPPCRAFPPVLPPPYNPQARHLPLERGSSLGWDQYERANAGNSRAGPSPPSTMDTHRRASFPPRAPPSGHPSPPLSLFSLALSLSLGSAYRYVSSARAPSSLPLPFFATPVVFPLVFVTRLASSFVSTPAAPHRRRCRREREVDVGLGRPPSPCRFFDDPHLIVHAPPSTYSRSPDSRTTPPTTAAAAVPAARLWSRGYDRRTGAK